jgi:tetratricopeptide (TPR) repeat protein
VHYHARAPTPTVPAQLPASPGLFAGRDQELRDLDDWRVRSPDQRLLVVISGPGGVGKTTLALRWLHELRAGYSDGQLHVDLGGFSLAEPISPADVLEWFLLALGVDADGVPSALPQRAALYRSVTADRALVVLLDNAASAAQVRPLLPASSHSVVVVTSRWRLTGLAMAGARFVDVGPMDVAGSMALLGRAVDVERVAAEPAAVREIAELCDGLPLALALVGARLATHPRRRFAREVADLRAEQDRLAALRVDDSSVGAVFDLSYRSVPAPAGRLYRLVALHPGTWFGPAVAAAAVDASDVADLLDVLVEANLLSEVDDRRYRFHDLVRLHARAQAERDDSVTERDAAVLRMIEWYLDTTVAADLLVHPLPARVGPRYQDDRPTSPLFDTATEALAWLASERIALRDALLDTDRRGWHDLTWQFCEAMWGFFRHDRHYEDWVTVYRLGVQAAQECGHRLAESRLRGKLGYVYAKLRRYDEAIAETEAELAIAAADGDQQGTASALSQLGRVARGKGDLAAALGYYERSRDLHGELGNRRGVALARRRMGQVLTSLGWYDAAIVELTAAAQTMADLSDNTQYSRTLMFLGAAYAKTSDPARAAAPLREALALMRDLGSAYYQAEILAVLGDVAERSGDLLSAREHLRLAYENYLAAGDPEADRVREGLAALDPLPEQRDGPQDQPPRDT